MSLHLHPDAVDFRTEPASIEIGRCPECGEDTEWEWKRTALPVPALDAESIAAAMNDAYTYEDRDNTIPTLPFVDDIENFWDPFAVKVAAALREGDTP